MNRTTLALVIASLCSAAPVIAQPPAPAPQPPAGAPGGRPGPMRRPMDRQFGRPMEDVPMRRQMAGAPGIPGMPGGPGMRPSPAEMLLARTAELKLTDAQVTRLAAIARRTGERRDAMRTALRARVDSLRTRRDSQPNRAAPNRAAMQAEFQKLRDQAHNDLRDALSVLTPDQQATAWELRGAAGGAARRGIGRPGARGRMQE